jgi:FKBP-type peptidyl-prolyl cis-trans isomerase 2
MIKGFDEAVLMMQKGSKVKVYIPSMLAYGPAGNPPKIKPFENLMFDLELTDIQKAGTDQRQMPPSLEKVDVPQPKK